MKRIQLDEAIAQLERKIKVCENNKKRILSYVNKVKNKCLRKEITYFEYERLLILEGKTAQEWIDYYNFLIERYRKKIRRFKKNKTRKNVTKKVVFVFIPLLIILILVFFFIGEQQTDYIERINFKITKNLYINPEKPAKTLHSKKLISKITGFSILEKEEEIVEKYNKDIDLEIKKPPSLAGNIITKNKNKRMNFDIDGGLRIYFELMNYTEFIRNINAQIETELEQSKQEKEQSGYGVGKSRISSKITGFIVNFLKITSRTIGLSKNSGYGIAKNSREINIERVRRKIKELSGEELKQIEESAVVKADNFDIFINETAAKEYNVDYKWGYRVKLKDLKFMAKIDVTSNKEILILDNASLRIGNNILSFQDLVDDGYDISLSTPILKIREDLTSEVSKEIPIEKNVTKTSEENLTEKNIKKETKKEKIEEQTGYGINTGYGITGILIGFIIKIPKKITGFVTGAVQAIEIEDIKYANTVSVYVEKDFSDVINEMSNISQLKERNLNSSEVQVHNREGNLVAGIDFEDVNNDGKVSIGDIIYLDPTLVSISEEENILTNVTQENNFTHLTLDTSQTGYGLFLYMPFDVNHSTTDNKTYDYTNNDNDGNVSCEDIGSGCNLSIWNSSGLYGGSMIFDGEDDYIDLGRSFDPSNEQITLSVWINLKDNKTTQAILGKENLPANEGYEIGFFNNNTLYFSIPNINTTWSKLANINENEWTYIAIVYNKINITFYKNGAYLSSHNQTADITSTSTSLYIGAHDEEDTAINFFNGSMDEFMLFNRTLNSTEISDIYNNQSKRFKTQGTQILKQFNVTSGNNRVNVTSNFQRYMGSNLSLRLGEWDVNLGYNDSIDGTNIGYNLSDGLVLYMHLDNRSDYENDTHIFDFSGNGNNGTINGSAVWTSDGYYSGAFKFDGLDDYIDVGNDSILNITNDFTISLWFYYSDEVCSSNKDTLIAKDDVDTARSWTLYCRNSTRVIPNSVAFEMFDNNSYDGPVNSTADALVLNSWNHVLVTFNSTYTGKIYVNGVSKGEKDNKVPLNSVSTNITIGARISPTSTKSVFFNGTIDEVMIFNRTLNDDEIKELYVKGRAKWNYTDYQNLSTINNTFNISTSSTNFLPEYKFLAGNSTNPFYSPVLIADIKFDFYTYTEDTTPPNITINTPLNQSYSTNSITFNITVLDNTQVNSCWYTLNNGIDNTTLTNLPTSPDDYNHTNTSIADGSYLAEFYCNDSTGNINNSESVSFTVDTTYPEINITYPENITYYTDISLLNYTYTEANPDSCWYSTDNGATNSTSVDMGVNFTGVLSNEGSNTWTVYCNDSANNENSTSVTFIKSTNNLPQIITVWNDTMTDVSTGLNQGPFSTLLYINFTATDPNGDLADHTAKINFTKPGEDTRFNLTCLNTASWGNNINYTCNVTMWWWDKAGTWTINVYIEDNNGNSATNSSTNFQVGSTSGFQMSPNNLTWNAISAGSTNQTSNNDPLLLNNTGNVDIPVNSISINATNLRGEINSEYGLWSGNFSVDWQTGGAGCSGAACLECAGTRMNLSSGNYVNISGANLTAGNFTVNDRKIGQEELYFCLRLAGRELMEQPYSTKLEGAWIIRLVIFVFAPRLTVRRKKSSKKLKRKLKGIEKDNLLKAMSLIMDELKQEYSLNMKKIVDIMANRIQEKYKINKKEIRKLIRQREITIPSSIFSKKLGALEAIVKYIKENLNMNYREISELLNRDERTIWNAYKKSKEKYPKPFKIKGGLTLPISIFKNKCTILESIIVYLRNKRFKFVDIAKLLNRDQRNIWRIYSRADKKIKLKKVA